MGVAGIEKFMEEMKDEFALYYFLLVKAPDTVFEEASLKDLEGNPIDCNIYHPKYGYDGSVADNYQTTLTSYKATIYQDPKTNKTIWCRHNVAILCLHKDGTLTNKDGVFVTLGPFVFQNQQRLIEENNQNDFIEIYDRELEKEGLANKPFTHSMFKSVLAERVESLIEKHKRSADKNDKTANAEWLTLAVSLVEYLRAKETIPNNTVPPVDQQPDKYHNFLAEVTTIERRVLDSGHHYFNTIFHPELYTPLKTLWESFGDKGSKETIEEFRKQVRIYLDYAKDAADKFLNDYNKEVKKQPDKKEVLLIENRDWYVKWLADTYKPVDLWYHHFWDEAQRTLNVDKLEREMFHFCHYQNKPFIVALIMMQSLYGYYFALEQFNALIMPRQNTTPPPLTLPANEGTKSERRQRASTKKRHEQYEDDFKNFQSIEGKDRLEAIRLTAEKYKVSIDTVERALGLKK